MRDQRSRSAARASIASPDPLQCEVRPPRLSDSGCGGEHPVPTAYRRLLEQRRLGSSRRLRRLDVYGVFHIQITEALMELRGRLRLPR